MGCGTGLGIWRRGWTLALPTLFVEGGAILYAIFERTRETIFTNRLPTFDVVQSRGTGAVLGGGAKSSFDAWDDRKFLDDFYNWHDNAINVIQAAPLSPPALHPNALHPLTQVIMPSTFFLLACCTIALILVWKRAESGLTTPPSPPTSLTYGMSRSSRLGGDRPRPPRLLRLRQRRRRPGARSRSHNRPPAPARLPPPPPRSPPAAQGPPRPPLDASTPPIHASTLSQNEA